MKISQKWALIDVSIVEKTVRARVIRDYMRLYDIKRAICFSCGNATRLLKEVGVDVLAIAPGGDMLPGRWFMPGEIASKFPGYFDATSGHLPFYMMVDIAKRLQYELNFKPGEHYAIPTGSGETIICLQLAFPETSFMAVYDDNDPATTYEDLSPLNSYVQTFFKWEHKKKQDAGITEHPE